jgi:hypothetical protein
MKSFITIGIIIIAAWVGWKIYEDRQNIRAAQARAAAVAAIDPRGLPGMPDQWKETLETSLTIAQRHGAPGLREWLKAYRQYVADPRRAWIELDYCVLVAQDKPTEAKRVFNDVKERTPPTSPIYPRLKQLEKTYE